MWKHPLHPQSAGIDADPFMGGGRGSFYRLIHFSSDKVSQSVSAIMKPYVNLVV